MTELKTNRGYLVSSAQSREASSVVTGLDGALRWAQKGALRGFCGILLMLVLIVCLVLLMVSPCLNCSLGNCHFRAYLWCLLLRGGSSSVACGGFVSSPMCWNVVVLKLWRPARVFSLILMVFGFS